jgi:hypothetical protein
LTQFIGWHDSGCALRKDNIMTLSTLTGGLDADLRALDADIPLVFIGMGAGVARVLGLADAHLGARKISLLWSEARPGSEYAAQIDAFAQAGLGRFAFTIQPERLRKDQLESFLTCEQLDRAHYVVAGANPAVARTRRALRGLHVPAGRIQSAGI